MCVQNRPDHTVPDLKCLWLHASALDSYCAQLSAFEFVSDQTQARSKTCVLDQTHIRSNLLLIRPTCVQNCLWSVTVALEMLSYRKSMSAGLSTILRSDNYAFMIRPNCTRTVYHEAQLRLKTFMIRLKRSRNRFRSDSSAK